MIAHHITHTHNERDMPLHMMHVTHLSELNPLSPFTASEYGNTSSSSPISLTFNTEELLIDPECGRFTYDWMMDVRCDEAGAPKSMGVSDIILMVLSLGWRKLVPLELGIIPRSDADVMRCEA